MSLFGSSSYWLIALLESVMIGRIVFHLFLLYLSLQVLSQAAQAYSVSCETRDQSYLILFRPGLFGRLGDGVVGDFHNKNILKLHIAMKLGGS